MEISKDVLSAIQSNQPDLVSKLLNSSDTTVDLFHSLEIVQSCTSVDMLTILMNYFTWTQQSVSSSLKQFQTILIQTVCKGQYDLADQLLCWPMASQVFVNCLTKMIYEADAEPLKYFISKVPTGESIRPFFGDLVCHPDRHNYICPSNVGSSKLYTLDKNALCYNGRFYYIWTTKFDCDLVQEVDQTDSIKKLICLFNQERDQMVAVRRDITKTLLVLKEHHWFEMEDVNNLFFKLVRDNKLVKWVKNVSNLYRFTIIFQPQYLYKLCLFPSLQRPCFLFPI